MDQVIHWKSPMWLVSEVLAGMKLCRNSWYLCWQQCWNIHCQLVCQHCPPTPQSCRCHCRRRHHRLPPSTDRTLQHQRRHSVLAARTGTCSLSIQFSTVYQIFVAIHNQHFPTPTHYSWVGLARFNVPLDTF